MLHFVIPFKSKEISNNWDLDSAICIRTIKGLLKQTSDSYTVTLACHQRPKGFDEVASSDKVRLIERPGSWMPSDPTRVQALLADKDRKLRAAMATLRAYKRGHVMPVDADDAVHIGLVDYVMSKNGADLIYADRGYMYDLSTGVLYHKRFMHRRTGASLITRWEASDLPEDELDRSKPAILTNIKGNINHSHVVDRVSNESKWNSHAIPFPSVCYTVGTGLNMTGASIMNSQTKFEKARTFLKATLRFWQLRYPSKKWRKAFGFD